MGKTESFFETPELHSNLFSVLVGNTHLSYHCQKRYALMFLQETSLSLPFSLVLFHFISFFSGIAMTCS